MRWIGPLLSGTLGSVLAGLVTPGVHSWQWTATVGICCVIHMCGLYTGISERVK